uniref:Ribosomal protein S7 n=1 Tax=Ombrophytum subterraneum TaxID=50155 RepID=A0A8E7IWK1_9MAGN|nr:ribosomal protein S7 [Ombrophytum subterraneum]
MYIEYDPIYKSQLIIILIKLIIKNGKKSLSYKIVYKIMNKIKKKTNKNPIFILYKIIHIIEPYIIIKYLNYKEMKSIKRKKIFVRQLLKLSRRYKNKNIILRFSFELFNKKFIKKIKRV